MLLDPAAASGFRVNVETEAFPVRAASEAVPALVGARAQVTLLRVGLEGGDALALDGGWLLEPSFAIGLRYDGSDAETGYGVDVGGGVR